MILTGPAIVNAIRDGDITIDPFEPSQVSPNAYDWRLGDTIWICDENLDSAAPTEFTKHVIPPDGFELVPGTLYLSVTHERTQSERYAQLINGDHTIGALGVWVHISAPLGHTGHAIRWTLEICSVRRVRIYPRMTFGKIAFIATSGTTASYQEVGEKYTDTMGISASRLHEEIR